MSERLTLANSCGEDGTFCDGCEYFGEPNGCNKAGGECRPYLNHQDIYQRLFDIESILYEADGNEVISLARLRELAEAERDGCVVALPFKIGDKAYWITHFGKMKASGTVVDILIRARDVLVGIDTENGSGTRKSIKDILYFQEAYTEQKGEAT